MMSVIFVALWCILQPWGCVVQTLNLRWALRLRREAMSGRWEGIEGIRGRASDNITRFVVVWLFTIGTVIGFFVEPTPQQPASPVKTFDGLLFLFTLLWAEYRFNMTATRELWRRRRRREAIGRAGEK